jgi:hypothetical protein
MISHPPSVAPSPHARALVRKLRGALPGAAGRVPDDPRRALRQQDHQIPFAIFEFVRWGRCHTCCGLLGHAQALRRFVKLNIVVRLPLMEMTLVSSVGSRMLPIKIASRLNASDFSLKYLCLLYTASMP